MRAFTPRQARQNAAFLAMLRRTGNPRLAARELGVHRSTYLKRRARCAAFAADWDAAILACHAALKLAGGPRLGTVTFPSPHSVDEECMDRERERRVKKEFGKRMRQLRKARGLSQAALASACGLDRSYLGRVERGESNVALVNIHRIAGALGVEAGELFRPA